MRQIVLYILFSFFIHTSLFGQAKKMCITVDDLPVVSYGVMDTSYLKEVTTGLIHTANTYNVPLIGYVNEFMLNANNSLDTFHVNLLRYWLENGHELGNHTYSHLDYNYTTLEVYTEDIIKGENVTRALLKQYNKPLMYFRHPYLHTGTTRTLSDNLRHKLDSLGYTESPVTIDNSDYMFAQMYHHAFIKNNKKEMAYIGKEYTAYMEEKLVHFENVSNTLYGRYAGQTLLIHASLLNAHYLYALIDMYKKHGYVFVSQVEILKDQAYTQPVQWYGKEGVSWLYKWSPKEQVPMLRKGDPEDPVFTEK